MKGVIRVYDSTRVRVRGISVRRASERERERETVEYSPSIKRCLVFMAVEVVVSRV
jgi:hypothetical protein